MQTSWSKYFERKQQESLQLTSSLMKDMHDMTEAEKIVYRKYVRRRKNYEESEESSKDPRDAKKNTGNKFQDKKRVTENSRVQPYPQNPKKTENSKNMETLKNTGTQKKMVTKDTKASAPPSAFEPEIRKVFPIYSHGKVCGYFYANENEVPPQKIALTNIGTAIKQTAPNVQDLLKPAKRTTTPQVLGTLVPLLLSNVPSNNVMPILATNTNSVSSSQTVNTLPLVMKPLNGMNTFKPLSMVPILPAPMKVQHFIPTTLQTNNIKVPNSNLLCVGGGGYNQNKTNIIPTFLQPSGCNINSNSCQSTLVTDENQSVSLVLSSPEKERNQSEIPETKQNCKLKNQDKISIKTEPESNNLCEENSEKQTESDIHHKNYLIYALPDSPPDLQIEIPDEIPDKEDKTDSPDDKSKEEEENDYGLVISSFCSLSKTNASELGFAFEN